MPRFSLSESDLEDADEDDVEPAHPIGFGSPWGRTWISLEPPPVFSPGQAKYGFLDDDDDGPCRKRQQSYPSLSSYINSKTVTTNVLLQYREPEDDIESSDDERSKIFVPKQREPTLDVVRLMSGGKPLPRWSDTNLTIQRRVEVERQRLKKEHTITNQDVHGLVQDLERQAALIRKDHQDKEDARRKKLEGQRLRDEAEAKHEALEKKEKAALEEKKKAELVAADTANKKKEAERAAAIKKLSQPADYIMKGKKLVAQLIELRKSIEPFDKSKTVSKRRLQMKKSVRGKVNTLSEDASKVQEVAIDVSQAISAAREEDAQVKQRIEKKEPGLTSDMARGKRYMVDLLASNVMQRIQAESFNGPRGDGFPLAAMVAMISLENKELVPILAAHIYTVCPIAIPTLPKPAPGASEDDLMHSLGMIKDKNGEFESWGRFSSRTENIVAMVSNVMASSPSTHTLLGGHQGASDWLTRFLDLLPPPPTSPLPLLTAPVLNAFLSGAGNMLANQHPDTFKKNLELIVADIVNRLDEGEIGKPSCIRLNKQLERGFEGFRSTLPTKAIPELYYGQGGNNNSAIRASMHSSVGARSTQGGFGASGNAATSSTNSSPFGMAAPSNPFSAGGSGDGHLAASARPKSSSSPFGGNQSSAGANPFGGGNTQDHQTTSFTSNTSPFGYPGTNAPAASNSFAPGAPASQTPFASSGGLSSGGFGATNSAGFGSSAPNASPFGGPSSGFSSNSNQHPSPFGAPTGNNTNNSFGGVQGSTPNQSSFGMSTPFAGTSSYDGGNQRNNNISSTTNFSGKKPCKFFAKGNCRFGNNCKFSHEGGGGGFAGNKGKTFGNTSSSGFGGGNRGGGGGGSFGNNNSGSSGNNPFGGGGFNSNKRSPFG